MPKDHPVVPTTLPLEGAAGGLNDDRAIPHLFLVMQGTSPLAGGARWSLDHVDEVEIGRGAERSSERRGPRLIVRVDDLSVSSPHARLLRAGVTWSIVDLGSTKGTVLEGRRVGRMALAEGALFELGASLFCVRTVPTPPESPVDVLATDPADAALGMATLLPSYALALGSLPLLPLRERREDLGVLVAEILRSLAPHRVERLRLRSDFCRTLYRHDWPLDVRELRHTLETALLVAPDDVLELAHAPEAVRATNAARDPLRAALVSALLRQRGNVSGVAREMGRTRMQIDRWMRRFGIDPAGYR